MFDLSYPYNQINDPFNLVQKLATEFKQGAIYEYRLVEGNNEIFHDGCRQVYFDDSRYKIENSEPHFLSPNIAAAARRQQWVISSKVKRLLPTPIIIEFKFLTRKEDSSFNLENAGKGNARFKIILVSHLITPQLRLLMNQFGFQGWSTSQGDVSGVTSGSRLSVDGRYRIGTGKTVAFFLISSVTFHTSSEPSWTSCSTPSNNTRSPFRRTRPRRVSTSPLTETSPSWMRIFASPPVPQRPIHLRNWASRIVASSISVQYKDLQKKKSSPIKKARTLPYTLLIFFILDSNDV